ncbi:hypothetical protein [Klebsiella pneumoniae IS10]|nr:hypothetical protein [Klebsiella pneumoniae IS10]
MPCPMANTMASVAAICRSETPRLSIIDSVASGAAKLTKLIWIRAKALIPVKPKGFSSGATQRTITSRIPRTSRYFMMISMITMIGNSVYSATSTDDLPAAIMMLMTSIYFFTTRRAIRSRHHNPVGKEMICLDPSRDPAPHGRREKRITDRY